MSNTGPQFSLVLIGRYPGRDMAVAQALARCMGRDESWGLKVVSAAPIVVFERLSDNHARSLHQALKDVSEAGCKFEIEPGGNTAYPKVGWSNPPKINGRELHEVLGDGTYRWAPGAQNPAAAISPAEQPSTVTLVLPCPYTGQKIRLTLSVSLAQDNGRTSLDVAATASQMPTPAAPAASSSKVSNAQTGTIILPTISHTPRVSGPNVTAPRKTGARPVPYPQATSDTGIDLRDKNAVVTTTVVRPPTSEHALPGPAWRHKTPHDIPLPDVPILPNSIPVPLSRTTEKNPWPLNSKPMDLSDFERQLGMSGERSERPFVNAGDYETEGVDGESDEPPILCSVFIERSSNPIVHELVAELHGIPEAEASEMCVSGLVALAENIPLDAARDITRRCAAINVVARIEQHGA